MVVEKLDGIELLRANDKVFINGLILYRSYEHRELNTKESYWEYTFYTDWDKQKNILPRPTHVVRIYVTFKKIAENEKEIYRVDKYVKGTITDISTSSQNEITSIEC